MSLLQLNLLKNADIISSVLETDVFTVAVTVGVDKSYRA
jgi:hypothetical protein